MSETDADKTIRKSDPIKAMRQSLDVFESLGPRAAKVVLLHAFWSIERLAAQVATLEEARSLGPFLKTERIELIPDDDFPRRLAVALNDAAKNQGEPPVSHVVVREALGKVRAEPAPRPAGLPDCWEVDTSESGVFVWQEANLQWRAICFEPESNGVETVSANTRSDAIKCARAFRRVMLRPRGWKAGA